MFVGVGRCPKPFGEGRVFLANGKLAHNLSDFRPTPTRETDTGNRCASLAVRLPFVPRQWVEIRRALNGKRVLPAAACHRSLILEIVMDTARYTTTALLLHWLMALLLVGLFAVGLYMVDLPLSPQKLKIYSWHKWAGVTAFLLVLARLAWRLGHPPPALPPAMPSWQKTVAHGMHHLLYLLMIAIPISGWLMSSAKGFQTVYFGVLPLPDLLAKNKELGETLAEVHELLANGLALLVLAHIGAALKHHLLDRDDVLSRMLPFLSSHR